MTIINNALSGAQAAQIAISATSQNIANLQTKGYTRQGALLTAKGTDGLALSAGSGVQVSSLLRFSDNYKSQAMWRAASDQGLYSQSQPYLTQLESVMGDDSASLSAGIDHFFETIYAVGGDQGSTPLRQEVLTAAQLLGERFNNLNNVFNSQLASVRQQRSALIDSANSEISTIASLNRKIAETQAGGLSASALIDTRDLAIDELSKKMALVVSDNPDGSRDISLKSGQALVIGSMAGTLKDSASASTTQSFSISFAGTTFALNANTMGGEMGGLSLYETNTLLPLQQDVGLLAKEITERINTQLRAGWTAPGVAGTDLFVYTPGNGSDMIKVADGLRAEHLAFSGDGLPGDTGNLQQILKIKNATIALPSLGNIMLSDADAQLLGKLAVASKLNKSALTTTQNVRTQAVDNWQSTSGVNEDEEAVNLIEFQRMYTANMKVISVANALFDATLAMMG